MIKICGIIGCVIKDPKGVKKNLRWIYNSQKDRGMRGAGFSVYRPSTGTIERVRAKTPQELFKHRHLDNFSAGDLLLFHHRLPTSTPNIESCNHPIVNEDGTLHLIHNGWVTSASYHYDLLRKKGHMFETEIETTTTTTVRTHTVSKKQKHGPGKKKQKKKQKPGKQTKDQNQCRVQAQTQARAPPRGQHHGQVNGVCSVCGFGGVGSARGVNGISCQPGVREDDFERFLHEHERGCGCGPIDSAQNTNNGRKTKTSTVSYLPGWGSDNFGGSSANSGSAAHTGSGPGSGASMNATFSRFTDSEVIIHEFEEELVQVRNHGNPGESVNDSAGRPGLHLPPADDQILQALGNTVGGLFGELTFAFFIRGVEKIFIYKGSPPCSIYKDTRGNTWFSSEYPKPTARKAGGSGETGRFSLVRFMQYGEAAAISQSGGYQQLGIISMPQYSGYSAYGYSSWNGYHDRQETLRTWASQARAGTKRGFRGHDEGYDEEGDEVTAEARSIIAGPGIVGSGLGLETVAGSGAGHGSVFGNRFDKPGTRELDDLVMDVLEDAVGEVWEYFMNDERWYDMRYIPLSLVESLLKAQVESSGVRVPESLVKKAAEDIWESL